MTLFGNFWKAITKKSSTVYIPGKGSYYKPSPTETFTVGMGNITTILEAIVPTVGAVLVLYGTVEVFKEEKHGKNR